MKKSCLDQNFDFKLTSIKILNIKIHKYKNIKNNNPLENMEKI